MDIIYDLYFMRVNDDVEEKETYQDFDDAKADYLYMTQEHPEDYQYVVLEEVRIEQDYSDEERRVVDRWERE